jgi:hypothetical protein
MRIGTTLKSTFLVPIVVLANLLLGVIGDPSARAEDNIDARIDRETCNGSKNTLYVEYQDRSECLTYYIVGKVTTLNTAVFFVGAI